MLKSSVAIASTLALLTSFAVLPSAQAAQFKKLLQVGQTIPGTDKPLVSIQHAALGRDGQVIAKLSTKKFLNPDPDPTQEYFQGIYSISKAGSLKLVEGGGYKAATATAPSFQKVFSQPSLSEGKIAYGSWEMSQTTGHSRTASIRFGTAAAMTTVIPTTTSFEVPEVVLTNGIIHVLETKFAMNRVEKDRYTLSQINTNQNNAVTMIGQVFAPLSYGEMRAGADRFVIKQKDETSSALMLLERPLTQGILNPIVPIGKNPGSCGFAVSFESVVSCSERNVALGQADYSLSVRFGKTGQFQAIAIPNASKVVSVDSPSMSQNKVVFRAVEQTTSGKVSKIYLSVNAKTPQVLLQSGSKVDGKTVSEVSLNNSDRSIALNSVLLTVSFTDQSAVLYRVDL